MLTVAKLPLAKEIEDFDFDGTPDNEALIRELAYGTFVADQRNAVLIGGTGTGKSHLAIAIARARSGTSQSHMNACLPCKHGKTFNRKCLHCACRHSRRGQACGRGTAFLHVPYRGFPARR
jgi:hypothetical protein